MVVTCWSVKGGVGTTVVSAALALILAGRAGASVLVDLAGDAPAVLGVAEPRGAGVLDWFGAGTSVPVDGLGRLEVALGDGLALVPRGGADDAGPPPLPHAVPSERGDVLAGVLAADGRPVVVDCGLLGADAGAVASLAAAGRPSLLVTRPCYVALRRALDAPVRPSGVVLVAEPGRSLGRVDVEAALGTPVLAEVPVDPAVARAVDAGVLGSRMPRSLARSLRALA